MDVRLPADLSQQVAREIASGRFASSEQLVEEAVRRFLEDRNRGERRMRSLRSLGEAVDEAGLYDRTFVPSK